MKHVWCLLIASLVYAAVPANGQPVNNPQSTETAQAAYDKGIEAVKAQDWKAAIQSFAEAQKASPNQPAVLFNLGLAHATAEHEIPAIAWLRAYLCAEPTAPNATAVRAEIQRLEAQAQDRLTKMAQAAAAAAQQISQSAAREKEVAQIAARQAGWGDLEGAIQTLKALKPDAKTLDSLTQSLWRELAFYRASQGDVKGAQEALGRAPEEQPPSKTLNFDSLNTKAGPVTIAPMLFFPFGALLTQVSTGTKLEVVNEDHLYSGKAAKAPSPKNMLTQNGSNDPVSFTLHFMKPVKSLSFKRAGLLAGPNGIIHPAWSATALTPEGEKVDSVGEELLRSFEDVPERVFVLNMVGARMVRFHSDNQHVAAFSAVLLDDLVQYPASEVQDNLRGALISYHFFLLDFEAARQAADNIEDPDKRKRYIDSIEKAKGQPPPSEIAFRAMYADHFSQGRPKVPDWQILFDPENQLKEISQQVTPEDMAARLISSASIFASALGTLRNIERRFPPSLPTAQDYLDRGMARYQRGDLRGMIEDFTKAIELDPSRKAEIEPVIERVRRRLTP